MKNKLINKVILIFINFMKSEEKNLHVYFVSTKAISKSWILYYFVYYQSKPDMNEWKKFSNFLWTPRQWNHCLFIPTRSYKKKNPLCHRYLFICWRTTAESINHFAKSRKLSDKISYMCQQRRIQASRI